MSKTLLWIQSDPRADHALSRTLAERGFSLATVNGIEALGGFAGDRDLVAILTDAEYLEAAAQVREQHRRPGEKLLPLLVISRASDLETRLRALRQGADAYFPPPLEVGAVADKLVELVGLDAGASPYRVMVVDDDPSQANFAAAILRKSGFEVCTVTHSLKILDTLRSCKPELILMDVYMPDASGVELTTIIREQPDLMDIPVVYLSAEHDPDKQLDALSVGGEDFLTKPIRPRHLVATVRNRIDRARQLRGRIPEGRRQEGDPALVRKHILELLERIHSTRAAEDQAIGLFYLELDTPLLLLDQLNLDGIDQLMAGLKTQVRQLAEEADRVTRFGDFCLVLIAQREDEHQLTGLARRLQQQLNERSFPVGSQAIRTGTSIGLRLLDASDQDASQLINEAIRACHQARSDDHGGVRVHRSAQADQVRAQKAVDKDLLERITDPGNLQILHQPVVPLMREHTPLYQSLLRLRSPGGELLMAGEFLPAVEQTGMILKLDRWVILQGINLLRRLRTDDARGRSARLLVSQSASALRDTARAAWIKSSLARTGVDAQGLVLEFRFPEIASDTPRAREYLEQLRTLGLGLSLNSVRELDALLRNMNQLPSDYIKITESQIRNYPDTWSDLVQRAHELGRRVIVSRIEHPELLGQLWTHGVDYIQGNFVQHPAQELNYDFTGAILG